LKASPFQISPNIPWRAVCPIWRAVTGQLFPATLLAGIVALEIQGRRRAPDSAHSLDHYAS
jgi:hypothetical protein